MALTDPLVFTDSCFFPEVSLVKISPILNISFFVLCFSFLFFFFLLKIILFLFFLSW